MIDARKGHFFLSFFLSFFFLGLWGLGWTNGGEMEKWDISDTYVKDQVIQV